MSSVYTEMLYTNGFQNYISHDIACNTLDSPSFGLKINNSCICYGLCVGTLFCFQINLAKFSKQYMECNLETPAINPRPPNPTTLRLSRHWTPRDHPLLPTHPIYDHYLDILKLDPYTPAPLTSLTPTHLNPYTQHTPELPPPTPTPGTALSSFVHFSNYRTT